jgi:CO/xanthine dehydrogenase FAD-binding subunit
MMRSGEKLRMAIVHQFEYLKPETLDEVVQILAEHGCEAQVLAGGTDLIAWVREELLTPSVLVDIKGIDSLKELVLVDDILFIGALVTFSELIGSTIIQKKFPLILEMAKSVASTGVRNRATLVGNICSAVPSCDSGPVLLAYETNVLVKGPRGEKKVPLRDWFLGPKQNALKEGQVATGLSLPLPGEKHGGSYLKLGRYRGDDLAQASVSVLALPENVYRIAFGAVAPRPVRAKKIESLVNGKKLEDSLIEQAQKLLPQEIAPITDIRASREYRTHMMKVMLERGMRAAKARLSGEGPPYGTSLI